MDNTVHGLDVYSNEGWWMALLCHRIPQSYHFYGDVTCKMLKTYHNILRLWCTIISVHKLSYTKPKPTHMLSSHDFYALFWTSRNQHAYNKFSFSFSDEKRAVKHFVEQGASFIFEECFLLSGLFSRTVFRMCWLYSWFLSHFLVLS